MKQVSHRGYLLVEVPEDARDILLTNAHVDNDLVYPNQYGTFNHIAMIPPGQWEIIGKGNEITEEVWRGIVEIEHPHDFYKNYADGFGMYLTATNSGHSLIKSHGMKPETTLILKLKTNE